MLAQAWFSSSRRPLRHRHTLQRQTRRRRVAEMTALDSTAERASLPTHFERSEPLRTPAFRLAIQLLEQRR